MGNAQSYTYADRQRGVWISAGPHHHSGSDVLRRTQSPTDEYMPEFGYTPGPCGRRMPRVASTPSGRNLVSSEYGNERLDRHSLKAPDPRLMKEPMPASKSRAPVQAKALKSQSEGPIQDGHLVPFLPARNTSDGHVHFEANPMKGIHYHAHAHDRPRTPYPEPGNRARRIAGSALSGQVPV